MTAPESLVTRARPLGSLVIVMSVLAAAFALALLFVPPAVTIDVWSYPSAAVPYTIGQVFVAIHHFVIAAGLFTAWRIGLAGRTRLAAVGAVGSTVAMTIFGVLEIVSCTIPDAKVTSDIAVLLVTLYGVLTIVLAAASIVYGIAIIRNHAWAGITRLTVLITGIYLIVPLIPAQFDPTFARPIALTVWCLLYIGLGIGLRRGPTA